MKEQNRLKSKIRSRVEHVFGVMKLRFAFTKVRYRGLAKNLHRIEATCALINLYTASNDRRQDLSRPAPEIHPRVFKGTNKTLSLAKTLVKPRTPPNEANKSENP